MKGKDIELKRFLVPALITLLLISIVGFFISRQYILNDYDLDDEEF
ncbi:MAG: hypothetical protein KBA26_10435 [Candidatus Delongbacteria bacterium]|nr:hypothetical protein [Candidatus Delongbacteria bacterium]